MNPVPHPRFFIMAPADLRAWAVTNVLRRDGGDPVTLNSYTAGPAAPTAGIFADMDEALTGRGSHATVSMTARLQAAWSVIGGAGNITTAMTGDVVTVTLDAADTLTLDPGAGNEWWGFPAAGFTLVGPGTYTGGNWIRGYSATPPSGAPSDPATAAARPLVLRKAAITSEVFHDQLVPSVVHTLRPRGTSVDSADRASGYCLEDLDNAINDPVFRRIRWGLTDDGRIWTSRPTAIGAVEWLSTTFRNRLGFTGLEATVTVGDVAYQVATYRCPGVLAPTRPFKRLTPCFKAGQGKVVQLWDRRRIVKRQGPNDTGWALDFWIDGPADRVDDHQLFIDETDEYFEGQVCQLWMAQGDPRLAHPGRPTPETPDGSVSHTAELHNGRRPVFLERADIKVEFDRGLMRGADVKLNLWNVEGG